MIYDIEEGSFDIDGIREACKRSGFSLETYHVSVGTDGSEERLWAHIESLNLGGTPRGVDLNDLQRELEDNDGKMTCSR